MRIGLTGYTGLIGAAIDRALSPTHELVRMGRSDGAGLHLDMGAPAAVATLDLRGIECLIHCAGVVDDDFRRAPDAAFAHATISTSRLFERAAEAGVQSAIYLSTAHVYGDLAREITEETCPDPRSDYAIAHHASEQIVRRFGREGRSALILRPMAVFGVPVLLDRFDRWELIPYSFLREAVQTGRIVLRSSGEQLRNFISNEDIAGYVRAFLGHGSANGRCIVVNPTGPDAMSVFEFAKRCAAVCESVTQRHCSVERPAPQEGEKNCGRYGSNSRLWSSRIGVDDYLVEMTRLLTQGVVR